MLSGTLVHCNRGEIGFGSDCVNLAGISAPSANAVVVRVRPGRAGAFLAASCAKRGDCDQHGDGECFHMISSTTSRHGRAG